MARKLVKVVYDTLKNNWVSTDFPSFTLAAGRTLAQPRALRQAQGRLCAHTAHLASRLICWR